MLIPRMSDSPYKPPTGKTDEADVLSVFDVNTRARALLERHAADVWVEGEIRDFTRAGQGHLYFTLADDRAQLRCIMYRSDALRVRFEMAVGVKVRVRGGLTLYEARGTFQMAARMVLLAGEGERAIEVAKLRQTLAKEGLFDPTKKRALPSHPRTVGVVTSRDGAAWHDIVKVALARFPVRLVLVHATVQGDDAPLSIVRALAWIQKVRAVDVVIVARGGGASEDLRAFDDERVVRAIATCRVPIVSGVGHEVDVTLADLVADVRAATPSNAAELVVPSREAVTRLLEGDKRGLERAMDRVIDAHRLKLERLTKRLRDPRERVRAPRARLVQCERVLERVIKGRVADQRLQLRVAMEALARLEPRAQLARDRARIEALEARLLPALQRKLEGQRRGLERARESLPLQMQSLVHEGRQALRAQGLALHALSPLAVLDRGYAIALRAHGEALRDARDAKAGERLTLRLAKGSVEVVVRDETRSHEE